MKSSNLKECRMHKVVKRRWRQARRAGLTAAPLKIWVALEILTNRYSAYECRRWSVNKGLVKSPNLEAR